MQLIQSPEQWGVSNQRNGKQWRQKSKRSSSITFLWMSMAACRNPLSVSSLHFPWRCFRRVRWKRKRGNGYPIWRIRCRGGNGWRISMKKVIHVAAFWATWLSNSAHPSFSTPTFWQILAVFSTQFYNYILLKVIIWSILPCIVKNKTCSFSFYLDGIRFYLVKLINNKIRWTFQFIFLNILLKLKKKVWNYSFIKNVIFNNTFKFLLKF